MSLAEREPAEPQRTPGARPDPEAPVPAERHGWILELDGLVDPEREPGREALTALADGYVGVSGASLADQPGQRRWTVGNGVYNGHGPEAHLLRGPVGLRLPHRIAPGGRIRRLLDLGAGVLTEQVDTDEGPIEAVRFTSLARPGVTVLRARCPAGPPGPLLEPPTDGMITDEGTDGDVAWMRSLGATHPTGGIAAAAHETRTELDDGHLVHRVIAYETHPDSPPPVEAAVRRARAAAAMGFDALLAEHHQAWADRWQDADIVIEGDDELQLASRFALFHLMGSVPELGEAAVGARGLTGQGYRGHVFWDADTFTLPFLAATRPSAARAMLEYRVRRLPAALEIARSLRRAGARFPWESAHTGLDVTPTSARDRTGRLVPIRTGRLEEHIVAQVAWAACCYVDWTGDDEFARGSGLRLLVETARYWRSRIRVDRDGAGHIYGVIGPDEYHEPVDDNAFTNVMARWNLRKAADAVEAHPMGAADVTAEELGAWRRIGAALADGYDPGTGVYEQFAGFHRLESLMIGEVAPRRPIAADLLLGADRVARSQIVKQADVLMLHHLVPEEVVPGSLEANMRFYEPRTAHGSSLSPPVHASLFARTRDFDKALEALRISARMDLDDLTQSTAGGLHFATMGGVWQALTYGFAGIRPVAGRLEVDPRLPPAWGSLEVRVRYRGSRVLVRCERSTLTIHADPLAAVRVGTADYTAGPDGLTLTRRGPSWEVTS